MVCVYTSFYCVWNAIIYCICEPFLKNWNHKATSWISKGVGKNENINWKWLNVANNIFVASDWKNYYCFWLFLTYAVYCCNCHVCIIYLQLNVNPLSHTCLRTFFTKRGGRCSAFVSFLKLIFFWSNFTIVISLFRNDLSVNFR